MAARREMQCTRMCSGIDLPWNFVMMYSMPFPNRGNRGGRPLRFHAPMFDTSMLPMAFTPRREDISDSFKNTAGNALPLA